MIFAYTDTFLPILMSGKLGAGIRFFLLS